MKHIKKMKIDIDKKNFEIIPSVQYDRNTRFLHINLTNGSIPFDLTGCSVKISGTKQDGTAIFNNCTIINAKKGFVEVELTEQINAIPGTVKCELKIYSESGVLTTKHFDIEVTAPLTASKEIVSSNEFKALTDALKVVQGIDNKADKEKVEEKFGEVYEQLDNIVLKDFKKIYGTKDNYYKSFRNLIDNLKENDNVLFSRGMYKLTSSEISDKFYIDKNNIVIEGQDRDTTIINLEDFGGFILGLRGKNITIKNITFKKGVRVSETAWLRPIIMILDRDKNTNKTFNVNNIKLINVKLESDGNCLLIGDLDNYDDNLKGSINNVLIKDSEFICNNIYDGGCGIHGRYANNVKILNNNVYGGKGGSSINLLHLTNSVVSNNYVEGNIDFAGIEIEKTDGRNIITNNHVVDCRYGIWIDSSKKCVITNNLITRITEERECEGILLTSATNLSDVMINSNLITNCTRGIVFEQWTSGIISDVDILTNVIRNCNQGLRFNIETTDNKVNDIKINSNSIKNCATGVQLGKYLKDLYIKNNLILNCTTGIDCNTLASENRNINIETNKVRSNKTDFKSSYGQIVKLINNDFDTSVNISDASYMHNGSNAYGNNNLINNNSLAFINNNKSYSSGAMTEISIFTNNSGTALVKGEVVEIDTSYKYGIYVKKPTSGVRDSKKIIGVVYQGGSNGEKVLIVRKGICDVKTTPCHAGDGLTNIGAILDKVQTGERTSFIAMEENTVNGGLIKCYINI